MFILCKRVSMYTSGIGHIDYLLGINPEDNSEHVLFRQGNVVKDSIIEPFIKARTKITISNEVLTNANITGGFERLINGEIEGVIDTTLGVYIPMTNYWHSNRNYFEDSSNVRPEISVKYSDDLTLKSTVYKNLKNWKVSK